MSLLPVPQQPSRLQRLKQRGLTTVEYALGLLAAATVALMLLRVFNDNRFFATLFEWVVNTFTTVAGG